MSARVRLAVAAGLGLRKRTAAHLESLSLTREYLVVRYDPGCTSPSQLNRVHATLSEVAQKVSARVSPAGPACPARRNTASD